MLRGGAALEFFFAARLLFGSEPLLEFHPMAQGSSLTDPAFRRLWTLFTAILGVSRLVSGVAGLTGLAARRARLRKDHR